jgi:hypothetical protein
VGPLPSDRAERGHDRRGRREELVSGKAKPVGGGAEHVLQPLRRVAVGVERPAELEHEGDSGGIGLVAPPLEAIVREGHMGSS